MSQYQFIEPRKILDMLFDDIEYVKEFCEAGISSFEEFRENFNKYLTGRDMKGLRKAGHKIKPGAQMMGADIVVEEYEEAKEMLSQDVQQDKLEEAAQNMDRICRGIKKELSQLAEEQE